MQFSTLKEVRISNDIVGVFGGYNHNVSISDGEFYEMKNLTSSYYPVLSPRGQRGLFDYPNNSKFVHKINGIYSKGSLCYVDGTDLYIDNKKVDGFELSDTQKQLASMGTYLVIMPDKKYINTIDFTDNGSLDRIWKTSGTITTKQCDYDGTDFKITAKSSTAPSNPSDGDCYIDTSGDVSVLKQYSKTQNKWKAAGDVFIKVICPGKQDTFEEGDSVRFIGFDTSVNPLFEVLENKELTIQKIYNMTNASGVECTAIVVPGFFDSTTLPQQTGNIEVAALMPNLDFVIESGNRLWGCRYGLNINGDFVNEIYASKLGDFKNWNCFVGTSMDSYTASCGSDGEFTGAIVHLGYPLFFKENYLHKVYGNYPANYQIQTTACRGVMKGCGSSLAIVNELLMYKSRTGICSFDGSLPKEISTAFGNVRYSEATAGFYQNKYYISMKSEEDNKWYLFAFDVTNGLWHKEDNTRVDSFCAHNGELYFVDNADKQIKTIFGSGIKETDPIDWMAESGVIGVKMKEDKYTVSLIGKKYISKLLIRMSLDVGSRVMFFIQYDSTGEWEHAGTLVGTTLKSFSLPIKPKRCDHFRLRIVGKGEAKIFSIAKSIEQGSDY